MQQEITVSDVLCMVGAECGGKSRKGEIEVICPFGRKNSKGQMRKAGVNVERNCWKCFYECPDCPNKGGPSTLYKAFTGKNLSAENIPLPRPTPVTTKEEGHRADADTLDKAYRSFLEKLSLADKHKNDLLRRGLPLESIEAGLYKTVPNKGWVKVVRAMEREGVVFDGVPGFFREKGRNKPVVWKKGYFIPYFDLRGRIVGLQIRDDDPKETSSKYTWFSSSGYEGGTSAENAPSFGVPNDMPKITEKSAVYITEGALKGHVASALDPERHPFISVAGVCCYKQFESVCKTLKEIGVTSVIDAFDSDRETNPHVRRSIRRMYKIASDYGIKMTRFDWGTEQKGIDDYFLAFKNKPKKHLVPPPAPHKANPAPPQAQKTALPLVKNDGTKKSFVVPPIRKRRYIPPPVKN